MPPSDAPAESLKRRPAMDDIGEGVPRLLLHAFPLSRRMWQPQLAGLADSCRLLAPDLPGFGGSPPWPAAAAAHRGSGPGAGGGGAAGDDRDGSGTGGDARARGGGEAAACRMEDMAAAAVARLDEAGVAAAVVCGLSMGGYVALALYEVFRERVRGLVLADTRAAADDEAGRGRRLESARAVESGGPPALAALASSLVPRLIAPRTRTTRSELVAWLHREIAEAPPAGVAAAQRGMAERPDRTHLLPRIAVPTLVVVGEEDEITPPAESVILRDRIPGAHLVTVAGAGHLSSLERPEAWNAALREFLRCFAPNGAGASG
ncbi:MAG TPA: alpha/beta fold hydrolase [Thermoanaerobaculia bacterium]